MKYCHVDCYWLVPLQKEQEERGIYNPGHRCLRYGESVKHPDTLKPGIQKLEKCKWKGQ